MPFFFLVGCALGLSSTSGDGEQLVTLDPSDVLAFGRISSGGRTRPLTLTLANEGGTTFEVTDATIESDAPGAFVFGSTLPLPVTLGPTQVFPILVRFGALDEIPYDGTVTLTLDDGSTHTVALEGEGCRDADGDNACDR